MEGKGYFYDCKQLGVIFRKKGVIYFYRTVQLESVEMWCWRRIENIIWTDHVRNEEVLLTVKEQRNILQEIRKRKANWIGHILRRNCLLQQVIEGKIKGGYRSDRKTRKKT